ncbi:iron ABC transporter substrate-binding protein [Rhodococcus sp. SRB_17]|uniref:iron-siderophore ABC transporter substrate-binding protein n=1 Tax=Rhodococcus sp. OK302 TaxID=1882769 RepID=UPI000B93B416|nr:iron-siderophore ABC transporter substrate-binding protein [Rhodococcus sp. OK302]NMM86334.1 iron ABC transporter substrate-binding protein [Rhodococcus sp. SRB_17]OYD69767.1 iron complex transport system substrate-binding protein [Rhodococcus sp. OK302]
MKSSLRGLAALGLAAITAAALVSCSSDSESSTASTSADGFPVSIENVFGTTTIESQPERLVTLGWNAQDILYALGLAPVGQPKYTYGADDNGVMPWAQKYFDADKTTLFDMAATGEPPVEIVASLAPDVILAPYEGFEKSVYDQLSKIAPTAAYPAAAWQTSWQDQTRIVGKAVGKSAEADKLVDGLGTTLTETASAHPEYAGKTIAVVNFDTDASNINVYLPTDPRVQVLTELGFVNAPGVEKLAADNSGGTFFKTISYENINDIDADVIVGFTDGSGDPSSIPAVGGLDAVKRGSTVFLSDTKVIGGLSNVNVLSVPWVLGQITPALTDAANRVG